MFWNKKYQIEEYSEKKFLELDHTQVFKSKDSPSGYVVSFHYKDPKRNWVGIIGDWMFSDKEHSSQWDSGRFWPHEWKNTYFPHTLLGLKKTPEELKNGVPGNQIDPKKFQFDYEILKLGLYKMEKNEETGVFSCTIPLPSGIFNYCFVLEIPDENPLLMKTTIDPENKPFTFKEDEQKYSQIKIPYNREKQIEDRSIEIGCPNKGSIEYFEYPIDKNWGVGETLPTGVYLPFNYDNKQHEPYKVLYLSHGGGGCVSDWMTKGAAPDIMDWLIMKKSVEPMVIVTMDNEIFKWDNQNKCIPNLTKYLMPFIEKNFNVSKVPSGRTFAGVSAGGFLAFEVYATCGYLFNYIGIWSGGQRFKADYTQRYLEDVKIHLGAGRYDDAYDSFLIQLEKNLKEYKLPFKTYIPDGGHQWSVWRKLLEDFIQSL